MDPARVLQLAEKADQDAADLGRDITLLLSRVDQLRQDQEALWQYARDLRSLAAMQRKAATFPGRRP